MSFSIAPLLKRQNPAPSYGHGWLIGKDGKRWHPCNDQKALLRDLSTQKPTLLAKFRNLLRA